MGNGKMKYCKYIRKIMANRKTKRTVMWSSGSLDQKWHVDLKHLIVERKGLTFGRQE